MPHPVDRPKVPEKGKAIDRQEQGRQVETCGKDREKKPQDEAGELDHEMYDGEAVEQDDGSYDALLTDDCVLDPLTLESYAGLIYDNMELWAEEGRRTLAECYHEPFTDLFGEESAQREDELVEAVKEMIREAEAAGLIGKDADAGELMGGDTGDVLDGSDVLWDRLVDGSAPFVFDDGGRGDGEGCAGGVVGEMEMLG